MDLERQSGFTVKDERQTRMTQMNRPPKTVQGRRWQVDLIVSLTVVVVIAVFTFEFPLWIYQPLALIPPPVRLLAVLMLMIYMFARDAVLKTKQAERSEKERREYVDNRLAEVRRHCDARMDQLIHDLDEIRTKVK